MPSTKHVAHPVSRRTVVHTGAKLAYAVPLVAATMKLSAIGAEAKETCCDGILGGIFDTTPYGGGSPACCTCEHCKTKPGGVSYPNASYALKAGTNGGLCVDASVGFPNGISPSDCAPVCIPCGSPQSPPK
jgi:hypothetical protein